MKKLNLNARLPFGKYKGKKVRDIANQDPNYITGLNQYNFFTEDVHYKIAHIRKKKNLK